MSRFNATQQDAIRRAMRPLTEAAVDLDPVELFDDIFDSIAAGSVGITAAAADVDSLALGGGHFTQDPNTTSGLTFGYSAGRFHNGLALVSVGAGTIALSASNTNYVEVDRAGTVSKNTSAFTSGSIPLWQIVTGISSITSVTIKKPLMTLIGTAGVVGSMLSTMGATKETCKELGDPAATVTKTVRLPYNAGTITRISYVSRVAEAASDTNYWKWKVINKGAAGAGTTVVVDDTAAANSTKATGGSALVANARRDLTLTSTGADLVFAAGDVLEITLTKTAAPATQTDASIQVDSTFTG